MLWDWLHGLDGWSLHQLNGWSGYWLVDRLIVFVAGDRILTGFVFLLPYWFYWFQDGSRAKTVAERRRLLVIGVMAGLAAIVVARGLSHALPFRVRPIYDPASGFVRDGTPSADFESWSAFPSDTAAFTFALAFGLRGIARRLSFGLLSYAAITAGLFRIYLGVHYPTDSIAGGLIGMVTAWVCCNQPTMRLAGRVARMATDRPRLFYPAAFLATAEMAQMFEHVRRAGHAGKALLRHEPVIGSIVLLLAAALLLGAGVFVLRPKPRGKAGAAGEPVPTGLSAAGRQVSVRRRPAA